MRTLYVDASVFITLSAIDRHELLAALEGDLVVPAAVAAEIRDDPARSHLEQAAESGWLSIPEHRVRETEPETYRHAATHLGRDSSGDGLDGDIALLACGLRDRNSVSPPEEAAGSTTGGTNEDIDNDFGSELVIVSDDRPLRETCTALGLPVSGSIGILIVAVERGTLEGDAAKDALVAMDETGARLSASLFRRAERLLEDAANG